MAMFADETLENEKSTAKKQTRFRVFTVGTPSVGAAVQVFAVASAK